MVSPSLTHTTLYAGALAGLGAAEGLAVGFGVALGRTVGLATGCVVEVGRVVTGAAALVVGRAEVCWGAAVFAGDAGWVQAVDAKVSAASISAYRRGPSDIEGRVDAVGRGLDEADRGRDPDRDRPTGDILHHNRVGADLHVIADVHRPQDLGSGPDGDAVASSERPPRVEP